MARIGAWAREVGPWRLAFGLLAVGGAYARLGMILSGNFERNAGWGLATEGVAILGMIGSCAALVTRPRGAGKWAAVHSWFVMWGVLAIWGLFPVPLPASQDDFRALTFPLCALLFGSLALSTDRGREWGRGPE